MDGCDDPVPTPRSLSTSSEVIDVSLTNGRPCFCLTLLIFNQTAGVMMCQTRSLLLVSIPGIKRLYPWQRVHPNDVLAVRLSIVMDVDNNNNEKGLYMKTLRL